MPVSIGARIFSMIYSTVGIISFATVIVLIRVTFLENIEMLQRSRQSQRGMLQRAQKRARYITRDSWLPGHGSSQVQRTEMERSGPDTIIIVPVDGNEVNSESDIVAFQNEAELVSNSSVSFCFPRRSFLIC